MRDVDPADRLHLLLSLFLLLEQLVLTSDVTAVELGGHVLTVRLDRLASDEAAADSSLDRHVELLARNELFELLGHLLAVLIGPVVVNNRREGIDRIARQQHVDLDEL